MLSTKAWRLARLTHLALIPALATWSGSTLGIAAALLLLLPLPGIWKGRTYTCAWASMLMSIYCALLLAEGYARPGDQLAAFGLAALAALDFTGLVLYVRLSSKERKAQTAASAAASR